MFTASLPPGSLKVLERIAVKTVTWTEIKKIL